MAQAPRSPGMAGVLMTLVLDEELLRREALRQDLAQARRPFRAIQGNTGRKGSTSTRSNTPAVTYGSCAAQVSAALWESNSRINRLP
jgi:hypothetical protein